MSHTVHERGDFVQGVVAVIQRDDRYLLIRRSEQVRAPGMWCFPGGGVEFGETQYAALIRECYEELALSVRPVTRLWLCRVGESLLLHWWKATPNGGSLQPNLAEVAEVAWLSRTELDNLPDLLASNREFLRVTDFGVGTLAYCTPSAR